MNNNNIEFEADEEGRYTLLSFENVIEDKFVVVKFSEKDVTEYDNTVSDTILPQTGESKLTIIIIIIGSLIGYIVYRKYKNK